MAHKNMRFSLPPNSFLYMMWIIFAFLGHMWCMSFPVIPEHQKPEDVSLEPKAKKEAKKNFEKMYAFKCKSPVPKLFTVKDFYPPEGSQRYLPKRVMLHRCDEDAGCCEIDGQTCSPSRNQTVYVHFFLKEFLNDSREIATNSVVKLAFFNHTFCSCK